MKVLIVCLIAIVGLSNYVESIVVDCIFIELSLGYQCKAKEMTITSKDDRTITGVTGVHQYGRTNNDVKTFMTEEPIYTNGVTKHIVKYFPLELTTFLPNLSGVGISHSKMVEIHSSDLQQIGKNIEILMMRFNEIEILEADLFQFNPNLLAIGFYGHKLKHIEDGAFRGLEKLTILNFGEPSGSCIDGMAWNRSEVITLVEKAELQCKELKVNQPE